MLGQLACAALWAGPAAAGVAGYTDPEIAARDAVNVAASRLASNQPAPAYVPFTADIVHFVSYGQSLDLGLDGTPILSTQQHLDNLMLGGSNRAAQDYSSGTVTTDWAPLGAAVFNPLIGALTGGVVPLPNSGQGESPAIAAVNYLRYRWLLHAGRGATSTQPGKNRFVLTTCGIGGQQISALLNQANPDIFNRIVQAVTLVRQQALATGRSYQFGGVFYTQGERDVELGTSYAVVQARLALLQTQVAAAVAGITGMPCRVPWVIHQPAAIIPYTNDVHQAWLDLATTPGGDFFCAGPVGQYPSNNLHRTANGYRWLGSQYGKAMAQVMIGQLVAWPCHVKRATFLGQDVLADVHVPRGHLQHGSAYSWMTPTASSGPQIPMQYDNLGLRIADAAGAVPIAITSIPGAATLRLRLGRPLAAAPVLYVGSCPLPGLDLGTNICDSDSALGFDSYVYGVAGQNVTENIASWNGAKLVGQPYPLNNYLAIGRVPVVPDPQYR